MQRYSNSKRSNALRSMQINDCPPHAWRVLSHRRLQAHPAPLSPQNTLLASPLPNWLIEPVVSRLAGIPVLPGAEGHIFGGTPHKNPNHVLINQYDPGEGIFPHEDGGAYYPVVATVSLASHTVLDIYRKTVDGRGGRDEKSSWRILQESCSLLITSGALYRETLHGISETKIDRELNGSNIVNWDMLGDSSAFQSGSKAREKRISLTFRDVLKVKKLGKGLDFLENGRRSGSDGRSS